ncbi:four-carbon acid sugar kinase family protein [uncultured Serinicoccus sp.]|uniref:four-carbon acid sugar kinase family protein n=1 Tax=uncultured Serinicoccus sp. TaxID=735514 RepID=UPI002620A0C0|nr:four-carbon acid sugar kinase family protein [uncultured Serinicoccus sp.]
MARVLVVADDLTGANACAAGFARAGMRAVTLGQTDPAGTVAEFHPRFDVVVVTTESRHASPAEVRERVHEVVRAGWPVDLLSTRIDTTLRGNVGVATEAMLTVAREVSDRRVVALCMPAHPDADRVTVEGHQLLRGMRLESTELAQDPRAPVDTSDVAEVLSRSTDLTTSHLPLRVVTGPEDELVTTVRELVDEHVDVIVADAMTTEHLDRIAGAAACVGDLLWVTVDPGPGAVAMASALGLQSAHAAGPLLAVSGSATELTRQQLARLVAERTCHVVRPRTTGDLVVPDVDATVSLVRAALEAAEPGDVVLLATVLDGSEVRTLSAAEGAELPAALGRVTRRVLQETRVDGLYTTGGDITAAVLEELDGQGLEIEDEVVPLAVAGEIVSGPWAGLPMVTKGGLVGDAETTLLCLDRLAGMAKDRLRSVRTATSHESARR